MGVLEGLPLAGPRRPECRSSSASSVWVSVVKSVVTVRAQEGSAFR